MTRRRRNGFDYVAMLFTPVGIWPADDEAYRRRAYRLARYWADRVREHDRDAYARGWDYHANRAYLRPGDEPCGKPLPCPDHPPTAEQERARIVADLRALANIAGTTGEHEAALHLDRAARRYELGGHWK